MAYYDHIAKRWHDATGYSGGAFKKLVLNDVILRQLSDIAGLSILELGAGTGYFLPLLLRRFSGQVPSRIVLTDQSRMMLELAQKNFRVEGAEYLVLDLRGSFPFADDSFDLILATMVFNEVSTPGLKRGLAECYRVLREDGRLVSTVTHPQFVESLAKRGLVKEHPQRGLSVPGPDGIRLPVVQRTARAYAELFRKAGFRFTEEEVRTTPEVLNAKPGLRGAGNIPIAMVYVCRGNALAKTA